MLNLCEQLIDVEEGLVCVCVCVRACVCVCVRACVHVCAL